MANKKIIELDAASQVNSDAVFPLSQLVDSNQKTLKATVAQMQAAMLAPVSGLVTLGESSGSIASFSTDIADKLFSCYVNVTAVQAGSGTPAPDNVRAISGWSACELSANSVVTTKSFGQTVYGGVLDVLSGVLTPNVGREADLSALSWTYESGGVFRATPSHTPAIPADNKAICSCYASYTGALSNLPDKSIMISGASPYLYIRIRDDDYSDATVFKNSLSGQSCIYKLAQPDTPISVTPVSPITQVGQNNIFADCGDIDLKYLETIGNRL